MLYDYEWISWQTDVGNRSADNNYTLLPILQLIAAHKRNKLQHAYIYY